MTKNLLSIPHAIYRRVRFLRSLYRPARAFLSKGSLRRKVCEHLERSEPVRIVIGANGKAQDGWIATEAYNLNILDGRDWDRYFAEGEVDAMLAEHVWEHLSREKGTEAARWCYRFLKSGGHLRVAVPDGFFPNSEYIDFVKPNGTGPSADDHKELYTYRTFRKVFENAGFEVRLLEYFDEEGRFHHRESDPERGKVIRSLRHYRGHEFGGIPYRSLILDAVKPTNGSKVLP